MDVLHPRCAGIDISKRDAKVCVRTQGAGRARARSTVTTWEAVTNRILALRDHLIAEEVTLVVMEATSDYWKSFYYLLEDAPFEVMLVNARHAKGIPGRKTDVSDAAWLAELGAHGLVRGSLVPPEPIQQLRDLTRTRTAITRAAELLGISRGLAYELARVGQLPSLRLGRRLVVPRAALLEWLERAARPESWAGRKMACEGTPPRHKAAR